MLDYKSNAVRTWQLLIIVMILHGSVFKFQFMLKLFYVKM